MELLKRILACLAYATKAMNLILEDNTEAAEKKLTDLEAYLIDTKPEPQVSPSEPTGKE